MSSKPKSSKREAILDTTLDVVVERGFRELPCLAPLCLCGAAVGSSARTRYTGEHAE